MLGSVDRGKKKSTPLKSAQIQAELRADYRYRLEGPVIALVELNEWGKRRSRSGVPDHGVPAGAVDCLTGLLARYDSGYYWEDVQRALHLGAGLEQWPE